MNKLDLLAPFIIQRAAAIKKAMEEIARIRAKKQVNDTLNQRNGLFVTMIHDLPLNLDVLVQHKGNTRQSGRQTGPFKLLGIDKEICKVQFPKGPTNFRTIIVKLYLQLEPEKPNKEELTKEPTKELTKELIQELTKEPTKELTEEPSKEPAASAPR